MQTTIGENIEQAAELLKKGEAVAIPTETVYGLAANATEPDAVLKIFKAKERPHFNPLIIHLPNWESVKKYVDNIPPKIEKLAQAFTPGAITFLLKKSERVPDLVTAGSPKVAVRIPAHSIANQLLKLLNFPLAAPSANPFGYVSPTTAEHVLEGLKGRIPYILDGGPSEVGLESTIVEEADGKIIVRRKGGVAVEDIENVLGEKVEIKTGAEEHPTAPGQLKSHYATETPLYFGEIEKWLSIFSGKKIGVIEFENNAQKINTPFRFQLSKNGKMDEAAKNLFRLMREADASGAEIILVPPLPEKGLGRAINDRLQRAQHDWK